MLRRIAYLPGSPMSEPTSLPAAVVADTIVRTVELGVTITDAALDGDATVVFCDLLDDGRHCPQCGGEGVYRDTVIRRVTDVPVVGHPLRLRVRVPRYRCGSSQCPPGSVRPQHFPACTSGLVDDAAMRPLHPAPADDRPNDHRGGGPGVGSVLGHRQHHRHGRHPDDRGRRHHPARRRAGHRC